VARWGKGVQGRRGHWDAHEKGKQKKERDPECLIRGRTGKKVGIKERRGKEKKGGRESPVK